MSANPFEEAQGPPPAKVVSLPPKKFEPTPDFPVTWLQDAEYKLDTVPVLKGLIEPGSFVIIYGPSGSGKSFFTADLAQHIATGSQWRGRRVKQSLVVYIASEAGTSILKRFVAWRDNRLGDATGAVPLAILTRGPNLLNPVQVATLIEQMKGLVIKAGLPLGMVIFDTLSRSIHGGDENKAEDMTMVVAAADALRDEFQAATVYVHHSGKDVTKGARGHSALHAAADLVLMVDGHSATVEKVRDGVAGEQFPFSLEPIEIGTDSDGDPVTTCLLSATDQPKVSKRPEPTGKNQRLTLRVIRELSVDSSETSPGSTAIPKGVKLVRFDSLCEKALSKLPHLKAFTARQRIGDSLTSLQSSGYVDVHGDLIWLK